MAALCEGMEQDFDRPSVKRRRLHVLYIVSDVLHHVTVRLGNPGFGALWAGQLPDMVTAASFFSRSPRHVAKVKSLLELWEERNYLPSALLGRLHEAIPLASDKHSGYPVFAAAQVEQPTDANSFQAPSLHGESLLPWNDQPASCWEPHLKDGSAVPIRSDLLRPATLEPSPEDEAIYDEAEAFVLGAGLVGDVALTKAIASDFDQFGDDAKEDETSASREKYYGWTADFTQEMKENKDRATSTPEDRRSRSRSQSPYSDRSRSDSPWSSKRRRSRSHSRGRGRSPPQHRARSRGRNQRESSYSRSRSPASRRDRSHRRRSRSGYRSRSRSRKTRSRRSSPSPHDRNDSGLDHASHTHPAPQPLQQMPFQGPGGQSIPPPPPPPDGYQGTFPPPPPQGGWNHNASAFVPPPPQGGWNHGPPAYVPPHMGAAWGSGLPPQAPYQPAYNGHPQFSNGWGPGGGRGGGGGRGFRGRGRGGYKYGSRRPRRNRPRN